MSNNSINFSNYNSHLISRLHGRHIFDEVKDSIDRGSILLLNFDNVSVVTLSFATELFDSFKSNNISVSIVNANQFVKETLEFAQSSSKVLN